MVEPTDQQKKIIAEANSCVVIAKPGSGKTYVLSEKIKKIIPDLPEYKGVIAISYTNKASDELKQRSLKGGLFKKSSFFGTIDKFNLYEMVIPFGKQLFGKPNFELSILKISELNKKEDFGWFTQDFEYGNLNQNHIKCLKEYFLNGKIILELVGILSIYIFDNSLACKKYIKSRYSHIIIDEYQDSGKEQHELFIRLKKLGLCAIAVGDLNQSIFAFSGKYPKYLQSLAENVDFKLYPLTQNHRSHPSIVNYSTGLFKKEFELIKCDEIRVFEKNIKGSEEDISKWLNSAISYYNKKFDINKFNDVAILTRSGRTGGIIDKNLSLNHKFFIATPLDEDTNAWSSIFKKILDCLFNPSITKYQFLEECLDLETEKSKATKVFSILEKLESLIIDINKNIEEIVKDFVLIASSVHPNYENKDSIVRLKEILSSQDLIDTFKPAQENEIQIMTLHKSKGLEFEIVFHLDLYEFIMPSKRKDKSTGIWEHSDFEQDINLHYVGITRAKKCCVLCTSSKRTNSNMQTINGTPSEFLSLPNLDKLRIESEI